MGKRRYTPKEKQAALKMVDKVGLAEASRKLGIPSTTMCGWRSESKKAAGSADEAVAPKAQATEIAAAEAAPAAPSAKGKRVAKFYSPSLKAQIGYNQECGSAPGPGLRQASANGERAWGSV